MLTQIEHCDVGYCLDTPGGGFAFEPPRTVFSGRDRPLAMRAIQNCPAVNSIGRQLIEMPSPVGLHLALEDDTDGPALEVIPSGTLVQPERLSEMLRLEPPEHWRHPNVPVLQLTLPFFLVTDAPCMVSQVPPFFSASMRGWPGMVVAGRFPLTLWPRNLTWAFEWDRPDEKLLIRQGEPLCYFLFEFNHPDKRPRLIEAALTAELTEYREGMRDIHQLTPNVEEVWELARKRRPERLLIPVEKLADA